MLNLENLISISKTENVIFYKNDCPFCKASKELMEKLVENKILKSYKVYILDQDFDNDGLLELLLKYDWKADSHQQYPTKPQIFINETGTTEFIGGNREFYKSKWNLGDNTSGKLSLNGQVFETPNLQNPMSF